jgi:hypothetical protein
MSPSEQHTLKQQLKRYEDRSILAQLQREGLSEQEARRIAEISQYSLPAAIHLALSPRSDHQFTISPLHSSAEEAVFAYHWLAHPSRRLLLLRLKMSTKYLDLYTISLQHCYIALFEVEWMVFRYS